jgi:hypothetical protein
MLFRENKMKRRIAHLIIMISAALLVGCNSRQQRQWDTLANCKQENTELTLHVQQLQNEKEQLAEQLQTLMGLDNKARFDAVNTLQTVRIGKRSGFFDKDEDGTTETLVVYLELKDTIQDTIKGAGQVTVALWDLTAFGNEAKLNQWTVEPGDLHASWGGTIFYSYYRLKLPLKSAPEPGTEYTLKITFTDYLTGKVLTDQKVIKP